MSEPAPWWETFFSGPWGEHQAQGYPAERTRAETDFIVSALALDARRARARHAVR